MNNAIKAIGLVIIAIVIGLALMNLGGQEEALKIGVFAPLSGEGAGYGEAQKEGLEIAKQEINSAGGILGKQVELVYEDSKLDSKEAVSAVNKFVNIDRLKYIIAADGSRAATTAVPFADQTKTIMMITLASAPKLKNAGDYVFRVMVSDDYQGKAVAEYVKSAGYKKPATLYMNDDYGAGLKDAFRENYGRIAAEEPFAPGVTDFRTQLAKIKEARPDVLFVIAHKEFAQILRQAKELDVNTQVIASENFKDEEQVKASGNSADGVIISFFAEPEDFAGFRQKYYQTYSREMPSYADFAYDGLKVLANAINAAGTLDTSEVKNALYQTNYNGATGAIRFDANGEVTGKSYVLYKVVNGEIIKLQNAQ